ncbi:unnamed protein product [Penicillium salamii]|uniref:Uncharacterized protein n=1 Tax=Penicillium salamii TaxID=1612424 RepID=A0A9W4N0Z9_9EURO|nr:unnamed protein product [Penicillium salamii]
MLLDTKADVNAQGGRYGNALQAASLDGSAEVVKMLLDAKADVNVQGGTYGNALLAAVHFPALSLAINAQDIFSRTPLRFAALHGHIHFILVLLESGVDPLLQDGYGRNILDWAVDHPRLVARLHNSSPGIIKTDQKKQRAIVRQSIFQILNTLFCYIQDHAKPLLLLLQQLGYYLLFLDDIDNARSILRLNLNHKDLQIDTKYNLICDICEQSIQGIHIICRRFARQFGSIFKPDSKIITIDALRPNTQSNLPTLCSSYSLALYLFVSLLMTLLCTWHYHYRK